MKNNRQPEEMAKGAVLSRSTLVQLVQDNSLAFWVDGEAIDVEYLQEYDLIDETSISLHIGELYRLSRSIYSLDISGRYDLENFYEKIEPDEQNGVIIEPHELLLGKTFEQITTPPNILGIVEERRTAAGNLGLFIKGFIPPGLNGENTRFTIYNFGERPVRIYIGKVPPMKVHFFTLSGFEFYRRGREARVDNSQVYSSGAGTKEVTDFGAIELSYGVTSRSHGLNKPVVMVQFTLTNKSGQVVSRVSIYPSLPKDEYSIISCTEPFILDTNQSINIKPALFQRNISKTRTHRIHIERELAPNHKITGSIKILLENTMLTLPIRLEVECYDGKNEEIPVIHLTDPPSIGFERRNWLSIGKEQIVTAIIAAILLLLINKFDTVILGWVSDFLKMFFELLG